MKLPARNATRLLIAEDDPLILRSLALAARERGFIVAGEATTGPEAVDRAIALRPDAILMDIAMPGFSGLEATRRIQACQPTPIVIVTGHDTPELSQDVAKSGAGAYLLKPADAADLECAVVIAIARHADMLELKRLVEQKELIVREVYHRVANQLAATATLLYRQARLASHPGARTALLESEIRVRTMARIHSLLQESRNPAWIPLAPHLSSIAMSLIREFRPDITYEESISAEAITVPSATAMTCGMLVQELVMNSLRHAFPNGKTGAITLALSTPKTGVVRLAVRDNGKGMPSGRDTKADSSLGLMIVSALSADLGGTLSHPPVDGGTQCEVEFPLHPKQESP